jgi:hypothetical protein
MDSIIELVKENYELILSGGAVVALPLVWVVIKNKTSSSNKVTQKNIKAGGDVVGRDKN